MDDIDTEGHRVGASINSADTKDLNFDHNSSSSEAIKASRASTGCGGEHRLPSYLSLACTVNGYSSTTNYDPERLARSRDASPHRPFGHNVDGLTTAYTVCNNLLSPPNLVPLPPISDHDTADVNMSENGVTITTQSTTTYRHEYHHHQLSNSLTMSYNLASSDTVDTCANNGFKGSNIVSSCDKENNNSKSFIQQRVERLYGPGALAQGFFVMKKQKNKSYELEHIARCKAASEKHSKSMNEQGFRHDDDTSDGDSKSKSTLPVLRHLRPEFRAQLPLTVTKKRTSENTSPQKIPSINIVQEEESVNGHCNPADEMNCGFRNELKQSTPCKKSNDVCDRNKPRNQTRESTVKDGHYFMMIIEKESQRLLALAIKAEEELESPDLSEDAKGFLRSASGKARLLVTQKMQQFKGLCRNNVTQVPDEAFPTTNEDLQGFWDMLMLQVIQIDNLFAELETLKANNWEESPVPSNVSTNGKNVKETKKVVKVPRPSSAVTVERKLREIQRKKLIEEKRKAMREQQQNKSSRQNIEIYVPESS
nr:disks large-associated protein 4 isoform X2 [Onthophagus taurus]